jgi:DNA-binding response OmpR family regulator
MKNTTVLCIEGNHADKPTFSSALQKKGFTVESAFSGNDALKRLSKLNPDLVVVNAASMRSSGGRICQSLRNEKKSLPLVLIMDKGRPPEKTAADLVLNLPFTPQKLINRIRLLLPSDGKNILHVGPIRLDLEHRRVRCLGKNERLTPHLSNLLKMLMEHRGEVVERESLFKKVWETNYTGDTRTLDVHISWLRKAIEIDSDHPKFLRTVRGVGYRLDV